MLPGHFALKLLTVSAVLTCNNCFVPSGSRAILAEPGVLDLFSGGYGVARYAVKHGAPWVVTFDLKRSWKEDVLDEAVRHRLHRLVELKAFRVVGAAPICASFSQAVTPPVRSKKVSARFAQCEQKYEDQNQPGQLTCRFPDWVGQAADFRWWVLLVGKS